MPIPTMHPAADERNSKYVDMVLYNKRCYTFYSDDQKTRFFHFFFSKYLGASTAARQLGIHIWAA